MLYERLSVSERKTLPPAVAVSSVAFALRPPKDARLGDGNPNEDADDASDRDRASRGAKAIRGVNTNSGTKTSSGAKIWIPLVRRTREPFGGMWALPGGPTEWNETLDDTALGALRAAVHRVPGYLEQLYSFGSVERSAQAQRLVTIAYWALYGETDLLDGSADRQSASGSDGNAEAAPRPALDDDNVAWFSADRLPKLAFDHVEIVQTALDRLRTKTEYATVAYRFLGETFTLARLRSVYEAVTGREIHNANFRRQALSQGHLVETDEFETGGRHRPARLYRFREEAAR